MFHLPALPYSANALEPWISQRTVRLHHGKHQLGYIKTLNGLLETPAVRKALRHHPRHDQVALEHLIVTLDDDSDDPDEVAAYRNASQAWSHDFYWRSMQPPLTRDYGQASPNAEFWNLQAKQLTTFKALDDFGKSLVEPAPWFWIVIDEDGDVASKIIDGVDTPLIHGLRPLAVCDCWEHAYYLDYPAERSKYVQVFVEHLLNWDFVSANMHRGENN
jgi:Fe-Mn family superoxide dismutase